MISAVTVRCCGRFQTTYHAYIKCIRKRAEQSDPVYPNVFGVNSRTTTDNEVISLVCGSSHTRTRAASTTVGAEAAGARGHDTKTRGRRVDALGRRGRPDGGTDSSRGPRRWPGSGARSPASRYRSTEREGGETGLAAAGADSARSPGHDLSGEGRDPEPISCPPERASAPLAGAGGRATPPCGRPPQPPPPPGHARLLVANCTSATKRPPL